MHVTEHYHHGDDDDDEDNGNIDNDDGMNGLDDAVSSFSSTSADPDEAYFTSADTDSTTTTFDEDVAWKRPTCLAEFRRFAYFLPELLEEEKSTHVLQLFSLVQESVDESHSAESASPSTFPAGSFHDAVVRGDVSQGDNKTLESVVHDSSNFKRRAATLLVATVVLGANAFNPSNMRMRMASRGVAYFRVVY
eukprot:scaffold65008_cov93-Attheya_sp.AAC.1